LLDMKDVWDTKTALEVDGLRRFPEYIRKELLSHAAPARVRALLDDRRAQVEKALRDFAGRFVGQRMQDLSGWEGLSASRSSLSPQTVLFHSPQGAVSRGDVEGPEASWFLDALRPYTSLLPAGPMVPGLEPLLIQLRTALSGDLSFVTELKDRFF